MAEEILEKVRTAAHKRILFSRMLCGRCRARIG